MSETMTVTRALAELKLLDSRITKLILEAKFIACVTKKNHNMQLNAFTAEAVSKHDSIEALIARRSKIKASIMKSNSVTNVKVGEKTMTVIEAIEMKAAIAYKKSMLEIMRKQRNQANQECETHKAAVKKAIDANIAQICSRDVKPDTSTIQNLTDMMWKNDPVELYDPLKLDKRIAELTAEVEDFESNVDFVLSESNALTKIDF